MEASLEFRAGHDADEARVRCLDCANFDRAPGGHPAPPNASALLRATYLLSGRCRKQSPSPTPRPSSLTHWPLTTSHNSCGGGEPKAAMIRSRLRCAGCRFFNRPPLGLTPPAQVDEVERRVYERAGFCHRWPPGQATEDFQFFSTPIVRATDWCSHGEPGPQLQLGLPSREPDLGP